MSGEKDSRLIDDWMNEIEGAVYDLSLRKDILEKTRRLLTKAVEAGLTGTGHSATYTAFACFDVACRVCGEQMSIHRMLRTPLWKGLKAKRAKKTVSVLLRRLGFRMCFNCGAEGKPNEHFCQVCGTWLSRTVCEEELKMALSRRATSRTQYRSRPTSKNRTSILDDSD